MKKASALWGGTALLIELVILILALVRGDWMIPLLLAVFAGWSLWLIFTQLLSGATCGWLKQFGIRRRAI